MVANKNEKVHQVINVIFFDKQERYSDIKNDKQTQARIFPDFKRVIVYSIDVQF